VLASPSLYSSRTQCSELWTPLGVTNWTDRGWQLCVL